MSFMSSYKHLDAICRDINGIGVTGYIEDMEQKSRGSYYIPEWDSDYRQLKHYRWVRNQIAHETYADEENMCEPGDTEWLENFYNRIIEQRDPLALYHQAARAASARASIHAQNAAKTNMSGGSVQQPRRSKRKRSAGVSVIVYLIVVAIVVILLRKFF